MTLFIFLKSPILRGFVAFLLEKDSLIFILEIIGYATIICKKKGYQWNPVE